MEPTDPTPKRGNRPYQELDLAMASPASAGLEEERVCPPKGAITHVIFDFDGTLIDTQPFYTLVQERILSMFGKPYDRSIEAKLMGKKPAESAHIFVEETGLTGLLTPEGFLEERNKMLTELFPCSQLLPGVKRLVDHLHANGIPMCVATGTYRHNFEVLTQNHGETFAMMHHVVMGDDPEVKKRKPAPDAFLVALKRFEDNADPSEVLVFEDAPSGVAAAKNAGMSVVMVSDAGPDEADQVLSSLLDFKPSQWDLPPFKDTVI